MLATIVLLASLLLQAPAATSARDAFLEGWFQETAEGDLDAALKAYRSCIERGGAADETLVAKAKLRVARIAGARGELEAERALLQEVVERHAGTPAAAAAEEALTSKASAVAGTADAAVAEARSFLDEMLYDGSRTTAQKVDQVLRTLPVDEVLARWALRGGSLYSIVTHVSDPALGAQLVALAVRVDGDGVARAAIEKFGWLHPKGPVPEALIRFAEETPVANLGWQVSVLLVRAGQTEELEQVLARNAALPEDAGSGHETLQLMVDAGDARAADVVETLVGWMHAAELDLARRLPNDALSAETEVGARLRTLFPTWTAGERWTVALKAAEQLDADGVSRVVLDLLLADPEPNVRGLARKLLMRSSDPERRREGFERFAAQPRPIDVSGLRSLVSDPAYAHWRDAVAILPAGTLRECVYTFLFFVAEGRDPTEVVALGLDRGDVEMVTALFRPSWWRAPSIRDRGKAPKQPSGYDLPGGGAVHSHRHRLREAFATTADATLGRRLAAFVLRQDDEEIRRSLAGLAVAAQGDRAFRGVADLAAADRSASVRYLVMDGMKPVDLAPATRAAFLLDPDARLRTTAIARCEEPDALIAAAEQASPEVLVELANRAIALSSGAAAAAIFPRLTPDQEVAGSALWLLGEWDVQVVLEQLGAGDPPPSRVSDTARELLSRLPLAEDLRSALLTRPGDEARVEALKALVAPRTEEIVAAFREDRLARIRRLVDGNPNAAPVEALAERLVELDGVELAMELVRESSPRARLVGGYALGGLGEVDALRDALSTVSNPTSLVGPALAAGLEPELYAAVESGRLTPTWILRRAQEERRGDVIADLVVGPREAPRRVLFESHPEGLGYVRSAVDHLAQQRDVERLAATVLLYDSEAAMRALFQLEAYDRILADIGAWSDPVCQEAIVELKNRTGHPEGKPGWPGFRVDQEALVAAWRERL